MKSLPNAAIDETTLKLISRFSAMNEYALVEQIEKDLNFITGERLLSDLIHIFKPKIKIFLQQIKLIKTSNDIQKFTYPLIFDSGHIAIYSKEVQQVVCKDDQLCKLINNFALSYEEKVIKLFNILINDVTLERYHFRTSPIKMAILILKIGKKYCNCTSDKSEN